MDYAQRYEVLRQLCKEYGLFEHMEHNRSRFSQPDRAGDWFGADLALVDQLVNDEALYPVEYEMATWRAGIRLGLFTPEAADADAAQDVAEDD